MHKIYIKKLKQFRLGILRSSTLVLSIYTIYNFGLVLRSKPVTQGLFKCLKRQFGTTYLRMDQVKFVEDRL